MWARFCATFPKVARPDSLRDREPSFGFVSQKFPRNVGRRLALRSKDAQVNSTRYSGMADGLRTIFREEVCYCLSGPFILREDGLFLRQALEPPSRGALKKKGEVCMYDPILNLPPPLSSEARYIPKAALRNVSA